MTSSSRRRTYHGLLAAMLLWLVACGGIGSDSRSDLEPIASTAQAVVGTLAWPSNVVTTAPTVGTLAGGGHVGATGQYGYTLPIPIPQGRAGMAPQVSLRYSSDAPNGEAGVGFS